MSSELKFQRETSRPDLKKAYQNKTRNILHAGVPIINCETVEYMVLLNEAGCIDEVHTQYESHTI